MNKLAISKVDAAYIAGIIDGEGCIGIYRRWNRGYFIQITIVNTCRPLIVWLSKKLHANAAKRLSDKRPQNRPNFSVTLDRVRAYNVLRIVLPYLKVKVKQAKLAIQFKQWQDAHKTGKSGYGHHTYGKKERAICERFVARSRSLNQVGLPEP
jgi:hypothetical protein